uniref:Uncharacterized protein n=1 Tax=Brassica oleracea TaxID=3712 RepID=A0A3P6DQY4_BRAOL|nr:unnamed protein product [Brassica oleracea]
MRRSPPSKMRMKSHCTISIIVEFPFPNMRMYYGSNDPNNHVAQYKQRILTISIEKSLREATMCKGFGSTLTKHALQWYIYMPNRSIHSFAILTTSLYLTSSS